MRTVHHAQVEVRAVVDECSAMVERCARKLRRDFGLSVDVVELDDLIQFGFVGLLEATERFDPSRGTDFHWFARRRIRGAILDGLRRMTRLPRRAHQLLRLASLAQNDDSHLGDGLESALTAGRVFACSGFIMLQSPYPTELAHDHMSPEELAHRKRRVERVRDLVDALDDPDREIARRRLLEGEPLAAIAADLGISRPWAWRVLERACRRLSAELAEPAHSAR